MFSRTTIASSMSSPIASESAISVITFSVMPAKFMTMNDEMTEIGSVRPVMTVERHELRKMNTMRIVSRPPMISVSWTSATDSRMKIDPSRTRSIVVPGGQLGLERRDLRLDRVGDADGVGAGLLEHVERDGAACR